MDALAGTFPTQSDVMTIYFHFLGLPTFDFPLERARNALALRHRLQ